MTPARASANVLPMVGCPAIGSSAPGVKMRMPDVGVRRSGGRMNVVSEKFISLAIACIVSVVSPRPSRKHGQLVAAEEVVGEDVEL